MAPTWTNRLRPSLFPFHLTALPPVPDLIGHPYKPSSTPPTAPPPLADDPPPRRPLYRKKRFLVPLGLVLVGIGAFAVASFLIKEAVRKAEERRQIVSAEEARFAGHLEELEARYLKVPLLTNAQRGQLRRSRNAAHVEAAQRLGVASVAARDDVLDQAKSAGLVQLVESPYYWVGKLTHSVPYVTPDAAAVLDSIGVRFQAKLDDYGLPPYKFYISSVLRTQEDQAALRRVNVNASRTTSSHEFGTTFDIQFRRYRYAGDPAAELWEPAYPALKTRFASELGAFYEETTELYPSRFLSLLAETLIELENDGLLITVMERRQPVFHTTVAKRLAAAE